MDLNPAQREAVETLSGPLLVLAGAGTGKTRVVTYRIVRLIQHGVPPERILGVTFTNKAADEMHQRVRALLGARAAQRPQISTFHSLCVRILRRHISRLGYPSQFAILDRHDQEGLARSVLREIRVHDAALRPGELLWRISRWKTASVGPDEAAASAITDKEHLAAAAYRRYQRALKAQGAVDFDDLLLLADQLFVRFEGIRQEEAGRLDHLLVDEYQDTNAVQYRIVRTLAASHRNLCVVGDDDQSIYGWRGADVSHILRFTRHWPDAKIVRLETNYRSTRGILVWANRLIAFNRQRHAKALRPTQPGPEPRIVQANDGQEEARRVVGEIRQRLAASGRRPRDFAILFRTNDQSRPFETELRRARVPYVLVGGQSFFDRREVRDLLAYLRVVANPSDDAALLRVINVPPRGIGPTATRRLSERAVAGGISLWEQLGRSVEDLPPAARRGVEQFRELIEPFRRQVDQRPVHEVVTELIQAVGYRDELARFHPAPDQFQSRWAVVEEVVNAAASYEQNNDDASLAGFLGHMALSSMEDQRDREAKLQRDAVALLTLHAAKGLEFPEVYLVGMEEGLLPHKKSLAADGATIEEERRLCYVGFTRAQRRLTLTLALGRRKWGKLRPTQPSRFLYEATGQADNPRYLEAVRGRRARTSVAPGPRTRRPNRRNRG
ncbi:MAG TPA: AAA family ATPase [Planctomycetes bacterium]|nr:AAA family ATPase [Planctomycetota bacterium]